MHAPTKTDVDHVARLITPDGTRVADADLDPYVADVTGDQLRELYRQMAVARRMDAEGVALQRQGQLALWAPAEGQEAIQIGSAAALRPDDFIFPSYRELGVLYARGATAEDFILMLRGEEHAVLDPAQQHAAPQQIIIGAQALHAVGYAMGIQRDETDQISVAYFGDGATSQGDVNEAMIFASSYGSPVVFVCSNNQYAISEPVSVQSKFPIAGRAPGFGIPSLRVDGNDVLACLAAMRWAVETARAGSPAFIEAVTYRMGPHTTSDDPRRYRDDEEVQYWRARDPLTRLETLLRAEGAWDDALEAQVKTDADAYAARMRHCALEAATRHPSTLFDNVYAEPHSGLAEQRERYVAYLDSLEEADHG